MTDICSTRSPAAGLNGAAGAVGVTGAADGAGADGRLGCSCADGAAALAAVPPDSMKLRISFRVTRPLIPVAERLAMLMPCSVAILRTSGLDFVRRRSSTVLPSLRTGVELAGDAGRIGGGAGGGGSGFGAGGAGASLGVAGGGAVSTEAG